MNKLLQKVLSFVCCLYSLVSLGQIDEYINAENKRVIDSEKTELEIDNFIKKNYNNYQFPQANLDNLIHHLKSEEVFTQAELDLAIVNAKRHELRKLFFFENPDKRETYLAKPIPVEASQQCVNGNFESGTAGYSFWSDLHPQPSSGTAFFLSCATPTALTASNVINPTTNNFNSRVTVINSNAGGYQQFDPILAGFGVNLPTLATNGGTRCIKLNNTQGYGSSDQTTVSRYFPSINQETIDFNFSLVMDNKPQHEQPIQPFFRARVLDQFGNIVDEICIIANPSNCLFNTINVNSERRVLYTGWLCARLNVGEILNQPGTIEFTVSDCQPSAHFGTVYIDNICGLVCAAPQLGALNIDPVNYICPNLVNPVPMEVCGTYQPPINATLNSIILQVTQNNTVVGTITVPSQLTTTTFCFLIPPTIFGTDPMGNFEFEITATFNVNCPAGVFLFQIQDHSAAIGPDVSFIDCCLPTLTLTAPNDNLNNLAPIAEKFRERSDWIRASNVVAIGNNALANGVVYHAENFVELTAGFEAVAGSQFVAYPEGCTDDYVYRDPDQVTIVPISEPEIINLIKLETSFAIVPNPSNDVVELIIDKAQFTRITIATIDGKQVFDEEIEPTNRFKVRVRHLENGVYIVHLRTASGQSLTEKLIKN